MISSMTAFATYEAKLPQTTIRWDLKSVNHRYYEVMFKMPDLFQTLEYPLREVMRKQIHRGKINCSLYLEFTPSDDSELNLDHALVDTLIATSRVIREKLPEALPLSIVDILKWPEVIKTRERDLEALSNSILSAFSQALNGFVTERGREGKDLKEFIEKRLDSIQGVLKNIREQLPSSVSHYRERLLEKMREMHVQTDPHRLEQELVLVAQKVDVNEELDRLDAHLRAVRTLLSEGGVIGRHLDFFMQELNREANTLASKSISATITQETVELKVFIEQMREQVQNLE